MPDTQWRKPRNGGPAHAFEPGRRYSYCGKAERVSERAWLFSTDKSACVCLGCVRADRTPPSVFLSGLIY